MPWPRSWWAPTTRRSASISTTPWSTARCTRHPVAARARAKAQLTEENSVGSGRWPPTRWASRSAGSLRPANRNDSVLLPATLEAVDDQGLLDEISTLHLDRGYDNGVVRRMWPARHRRSGDAQSPPQRRPRRRAPARVPLGRRWPVERTNSWLSNYGQLRRNTDRKLVTSRRSVRLRHRHLAHRQLGRRPPQKRSCLRSALSRGGRSPKPQQGGRQPTTWQAGPAPAEPAASARRSGSPRRSPA